jgi:hypothetical protein
MLGRWLKKQLVQQLYTWTWASQHWCCGPLNCAERQTVGRRGVPGQEEAADGLEWLGQRWRGWARQDHGARGHEILQGCAAAFSSSKHFTADRRRKRTSSFKGVSFCATKKAKWRVDFMFKGKKSPVKFFVEEKAAAQHYNAIRCSAVCNSPLCSGRCLRGTNLLDSSE